MNPLPPPNQPNGHPRLHKIWPPEERKLWLLAKGCPPGHLLLSELEFAIIGRQLRGEHAARLALQTELKATADALGKYFVAEPDVPNGAAAAVFDAERFERAAREANKQLTEALATLEGYDSDTFPAATDAIRETLRVLEASFNARRDRKKPTPPANPPTQSST